MLTDLCPSFVLEQALGALLTPARNAIGIQPRIAQFRVVVNHRLERSGDVRLFQRLLARRLTSCRPRHDSTRR